MDYSEFGTPPLFAVQEFIAALAAATDGVSTPPDLKTMKGTYRSDRWSHRFYSQDFLARARRAGNPDKVPVLEPRASISCRCGCRALRHPSRWDHVTCRESILMIVL